MKIKNLALALSLAGLGVLQQVTAAGAVVFNFSGGGDAGSLDVTTNQNNAITAITGTINNQTVTGLYTGTVDYNPEFGTPVGDPSGIFPVDNRIAFNGSNVLTTFDGFAVNTSNGSIYNLYSIAASFLPSGSFGTLDSIGTLNNTGVIVRDNSASDVDFPNNSNLPGITATAATAVPEPASTLGLLALGALGGGSTLKKKLAKLGTKNRSNEKVSA
jgi:hypothetical protein